MPPERRRSSVRDARLEAQKLWSDLRRRFPTETVALDPIDFSSPNSAPAPSASAPPRRLSSTTATETERIRHALSRSIPSRTLGQGALHLKYADILKDLEHRPSERLQRWRRSVSAASREADPVAPPRAPAPVPSGISFVTATGTPFTAAVAEPVPTRTGNPVPAASDPATPTATNSARPAPTGPSTSIAPAGPPSTKPDDPVRQRQDRRLKRKIGARGEAKEGGLDDETILARHRRLMKEDNERRAGEAEEERNHRLMAAKAPTVAHEAATLHPNHTASTPADTDERGTTTPHETATPGPQEVVAVASPRTAADELDSMLQMFSGTSAILQAPSGSSSASSR